MNFLQIVLCYLHLFSVVFASPPKLVPLSEHYDLVENFSFPLTCSLHSGDGQISFIWSHNGVQLESNSDYRIDSTSSKFTFLTIHSLQRQHAGTYECRATNNFGETDVTKTRINVQGNVNFVCLRFAQNVALRRSFLDFSLCIFQLFSFSFKLAFFISY